MLGEFLRGYFRGLGFMAARATFRLILIGLAAAGVLALMGG